MAAQAAPEQIGEAVPRLRTAERRQVEWRPVSLEELVPDDHRARVVWRFVVGLDLFALLSPIKSLEGLPGLTHKHGMRLASHCGLILNSARKGARAPRIDRRSGVRPA